MKNIALFGGSFDPLHVGHEAIINALDGLLDIDEIIVVPTFLNPFKTSSSADAQDRYDVLKNRFKNKKNVFISDYEIKQKTKVPSIDSVKHFLKSYKKVYLVIGADNLEKLHLWQDYNELKNLVTFIVATRDNISIPKKYITLHVDETVSSTQIRQGQKQLQKRIENITKVLDDNKAEAIEVFDLREKNYFVEYAIIASSLSQRHTLALLNHMKDDLKPAEHFNNVDESGDWIVVDLGDILVHIMTSEYRVKYDMESFLSDLSDGQEGL